MEGLLEKLSIGDEGKEQPDKEENEAKEAGLAVIRVSWPQTHKRANAP